MTEVFVGQIMMTGFGFPPRGFALCNGQTMPIVQNQALFSLLGTRFGGDGRSTFALPDLQGRTPLGSGVSADPSWQPDPYPAGSVGGSEAVTVNTQQLPMHVHTASGTSAEGGQRNPTNALYGTNAKPIYAPGAPIPLADQTVTQSGGNQPHDNMQPFGVISFCIALIGTYPSRS